MGIYNLQLYNFWLYNPNYLGYGRMVIRGNRIVRMFARKHSDARNRLLAWEETTLVALWRDFEALKQSHPSVDYHSGHRAYIFDIGSNYRLVVRISFVSNDVPLGLVRVMKVMKHDDYMKWSNEV